MKGNLAVLRRVQVKTSWVNVVGLYEAAVGAEIQAMQPQKCVCARFLFQREGKLDI